MARVVAAFVLVALAYPAFIVFAGTPEGLGSAGRVTAISGGGVLLLGVPAFLLFRCRGWWQLWRFLVGGGLGGLLLALVLLRSDAANLPLLAFVFLAGGVVYALLFWCLAVWRNPGLTAPRQYCLPGGYAYKVARRMLRKPDGKGPATR